MVAAYWSGVRSKWPKALSNLVASCTLPMISGTLFQSPEAIAWLGATGRTGVPVVGLLTTTCCSAATRLGVQPLVTRAYGCAPRKQVTTVAGSTQPAAAA